MDADFVFLALHGGPGEDGRLQLALERLGRPYNGSGPRAADVAGDKAATADRVRTLGLAGVGAPAQRTVDVFELGEWLDRIDGPGAAAERYRSLCDELAADVLVCKPAADGCSTGVKILKRPEVMERFFAAIVSELPEFVSDEARADLRGRTVSIAMPVPAPKRWLVERAFVEPVGVELPRGRPEPRDPAGRGSRPSATSSSPPPCWTGPDGAWSQPCPVSPWRPTS